MSTTNVKKIRVAVLASNDESLQQIQEILQLCNSEFNCEVSLATKNSEEALLAVRTQGDQHDIMIIDETVNGISGLKLLKLLLEITEIPMIWLSHDGSSGNTMKALNCGARDLWVKPLEMGTARHIWKHCVKPKEKLDTSILTTPNKLNGNIQSEQSLKSNPIVFCCLTCFILPSFLFLLLLFFLLYFSPTAVSIFLFICFFCLLIILLLLLWWFVSPSSPLRTDGSGR